MPLLICPWKKFRIDVTFEMSTVHYRKAIIRLMTLAEDPVSFISKRKKGAGGQDGRETERESEGERASEG